MKGISKFSIIFMALILIIILVFVLHDRSEIEHEIEDVKVENTTTEVAEEITEEFEPEEKVESEEVIKPELPKVTEEVKKSQSEIDTERYLQILDIPTVVKQRTTTIKMIDSDLYHITTDNKRYVFIPSTKEIIDISSGMYTIGSGGVDWRFINGIFLPYQDYIEYKMKEEIEKQISKNRIDNPKQVWICPISTSEFLKVIGENADTEKADYYYFDHDLEKVRFKEIMKSEKYKDIACYNKKEDI